MDGALSDFWYWLNSYTLVSSESITTSQIIIFTYVIQVFFLLRKNQDIQAIRITVAFDVIPLNNAGNAFTAI